MTVTNLSLQNFRSYSKKEFIFSPTTTVIIGPNAGGKTNLLEAIFLLAVGRSFRAEQDREMIAIGCEVGRARGKITQSSNNPITQLSNEVLQLEIILTQGEIMGTKTPIKKYSINGVGKRMVDFIGKLKVVLFWPQDLELVTNSPSLRRRYLDLVLSQVDREYRRTLISYEKGLHQRNKVLEAIRDHGAHRHQLMFWDQLLVKNGEYITKKREEYINYLNNCQWSAVGGQLSGYQLVYDKSIISRARLDQYSQEEIAAGITLVGPHRDDIQFKVHPDQIGTKFKVKEENLRDLSHFGSRGEQRLAILWLKLGELAFIEKITGEKPVLLLDDILSELDHEHREIIFNVIGKQQTIITTTDLHLIEKDKFKKGEIVELV